MNKILMLVLIPCLVAFVVAQYQGAYPGYAPGGYGMAPGGGSTYYNYALQSAQGAKLSNILVYGLLFFAVLVITNATGSMSG